MPAIDAHLEAKQALALCMALGNLHAIDDVLGTTQMALQKRLESLTVRTGSLVHEEAHREKNLAAIARSTSP